MLPTLDLLNNSEQCSIQEEIKKTRTPAKKISPKIPVKPQPVYHKPFLSRLPDKLRVFPGKPYPIGASWDGAGVNFAVFSEKANRCYLCLFDSTSSTKESHRIEMPEYDDFVFHCYLPDVRPGQLYGFRMDGDWDPHNGMIEQNFLLLV
jgi:hypothetical protein